MRRFFSHTPQEERKGELFQLLSAVFNGLFPVVLHLGTQIAPPLFFAGVSLLIGSLPPILLILLRRTRMPAIDWYLCKHLVVVSLFCLVLPTAFIAIGTQKTSGINTALLLQAEMLFTFIFFHVFLREASTRHQILGALLIFAGTAVILYRDLFAFNFGDFLIVLGTAFYPIGNNSSKKIIATLHPMAILAFRSLLSGFLLLFLSLAFEGILASPIRMTPDLLLLVFLQGIAVLFISKLFWYEGLERLPVGRSVFIGSSAPAFSLIFAATLLGETPTLLQLAGFLVTLLGLFFLTEKKTLVIGDGGL